MRNVQSRGDGQEEKRNENESEPPEWLELDKELITWVLALANMPRTFKRVHTELLPSFLELCRRYLRRFFDKTLSIQERIKAIKLYIRLPKDMLRVDCGGHRNRGCSFRSASKTIQNRLEKVQSNPSEESIPAPKQRSKMRKEEE